MSINTNVRLVLLTSAVALATATAPAFAGDAGTWHGDFYTEAGGTPSAPAATYSRQVMEKKVAQSDVTSASAGTLLGNFYTEANGTPDAPAATYSRQVVQGKAAPSASITLASKSWVPAY